MNFFSNKSSKISKRDIINKDVISLLHSLEVIGKTKTGHEWKRYKESGAMCPKCSNTNIVDKICDTNGTIRGSSDFWRGSTYGTLKTDSVHCCSACGHEWKKSKLNFICTEDIIKDLIYDSYNLCKEYEDYKRCRFNKKDFKDISTYGSFEHKQNKLFEEFNNELKRFSKKWGEYIKDICVEAMPIIIKAKCLFSETPMLGYYKKIKNCEDALLKAGFTFVKYKMKSINNEIRKI